MNNDDISHYIQYYVWLTPSLTQRWTGCITVLAIELTSVGGGQWSEIVDNVIFFIINP